ncbi:MAG: hypothetical protein KGR24_05650 [Planctomycetes bacterium]|nr:hypothetical protein [Planctomycetota bacterium]
MGDASTPLDVFAVERAIQAAAPAVLFASPRLVRRIIRADRDLPLAMARTPHRDIAVLDSRRLAEVADDVIALPADLPDRVAVVARPAADRGDGVGRDETLREYWRLGFHALLDLESPAAIARVGSAAAEVLPTEVAAEAREVLMREGLLDRDATDSELLAEFIAVFLELRCFAPEAVAAWFPAIEDPDTLAERLAALVGGEGLLARALPPMLDPEADPPMAAPPATTGAFHWPGWLRPRAAALRRQADRTALKGNFVRASLDEWRAAMARPETARPATGRLERQVDAFARRLGWALDLDASQVDDATTFIRQLVERSRGSSWSPQARLLYDLQKICVDSERESFRTQLLGWLLTAGRRPLAVPLPCQRLVLIHRHAVAAAARLASLDLPEPLRVVGAGLLTTAVDTTAAAAREPLRHKVEAAIAAAGLAPRYLVEEAALAKLVDELLDAIVERGFVSFGSVRDAVSGNQLKLPDLQGPTEWLAGDELLQLDDQLAATLDGVYRPAPLYLSLMQRISAPFFGVAAGRLLTTHVLLPFGGAWIILRGLEHVIEPITEYSLGEMWHVYTRGRVLAIGIALWALLHLPPVRTAAWQATRGAAAIAHFFLIALPGRFLRLPAVERILRSRPVRWLVDHATGPLVVTVVAWLLMPRHGRWLSRGTPWVPPLVFAASAVLLNSRTGRHLQERVVEAAGQALHQFHLHVIAGLLSWIVDVFRQAMDFVEGTLYAVDESLRFRSDESGLMLVVKAVLGAVWSIVEAGVRFCITLLIEPQLNPIKHFPVVTVSHKLLVPMIPMVASQLVETTGMEKGLALTAVTFVSTCIPGVFGFLAWELKENWRLYAANRPATLRPVPVGHHGETMRRLLMPGFHSGTIPRLFARLRRRHARGTPESSASSSRVERQRHELEHDIATFFDRDVIGLLERSGACRGLTIAVDAVHLAVDRITVALRAGDGAGRPIVLTLTRRGDAIESRVVESGWLDELPPDAGEAVRLALAGYQRLAAADEATAEFAHLSSAEAPMPPNAEALEPVTPIAWTAWRDAWERLRRDA